MFAMALPFLLTQCLNLNVSYRISVNETICDPPFDSLNVAIFTMLMTKVCTYLVQDSNPQAVWSMDPSFDISFAALSGRFDGMLHLWDVREDEPVKSFLLKSTEAFKKF